VSAPISYRAEFANQVLVRLRRFDELKWASCEYRLEERAQFFDVAYRLGESAIELLVEEFGPDLQQVLRARLGDVDAIFGMVPLEETLDPGPARWRVARAAILAAWLRDSRGFNLGAFEELFRPVASHIDLADLERTVQMSLGTQVEDASATVRPVEEPAPALRDIRQA
jgi:hypothetical protein